MVSKNTFAAVFFSIWLDYKRFLEKQFSAEDLPKHLGLDEFVKWLETYDQANQSL